MNPGPDAVFNIFRISHSQIFFKIDVLKNFTNLLEPLFNKVAGLRCSPVKYAKVLRTAFFTEHLRWLLLYLDFLKFINKGV